MIASIVLCIALAQAPTAPQATPPPDVASHVREVEEFARASGYGRAGSVSRFVKMFWSGDLDRKLSELPDGKLCWWLGAVDYVLAGMEAQLGNVGPLLATRKWVDQTSADHCGGPGGKAAREAWASAGLEVLRVGALKRASAARFASGIPSVGFGLACDPLTGFCVNPAAPPSPRQALAVVAAMALSALAGPAELTLPALAQWAAAAP